MDNRLINSALASFCILLAGYFSLQAGTQDWSVWTAESARRIDIAQNPRTIPKTSVLDAQGRYRDLSELEKPLILVDFIYTQCPTVCISLGLEFNKLQSDLSRLGLDHQVQLLSLSFDLENDGPLQLQDYLDRFGARDKYWTAAVFSNDIEKQRVLEELGVIVIPEPQLGFVHNAGVYLVHKGRVVEVFNYQDREKILVAIRAYLT